MGDNKTKIKDETKKKSANKEMKKMAEASKKGKAVANKKENIKDKVKAEVVEKKKKKGHREDLPVPPVYPKKKLAVKKKEIEEGKVKKLKRYKKRWKKRKGRRSRSSASTSSHTSERDTSESEDSDLDLKKQVHLISKYIGNRNVMMQQMFRAVGSKQLQALLPDILKKVPLDELQSLCLDQLEVMSKKRILCTLEGIEMLSSSGTDEDEEEEEKEDLEYEEEEDKDDEGGVMDDEGGVMDDEGGVVDDEGGEVSQKQVHVIVEDEDMMDEVLERIITSPERFAKSADVRSIPHKPSTSKAQSRGPALDRTRAIRSQIRKGLPIDSDPVPEDDAAAVGASSPKSSASRDVTAVKATKVPVSTTTTMFKPTHRQFRRQRTASHSGCSTCSQSPSFSSSSSNEAMSDNDDGDDNDGAIRLPKAFRIRNRSSDEEMCRVDPNDIDGIVANILEHKEYDDEYHSDYYDNGEFLDDDGGLRYPVMAPGEEMVRKVDRMVEEFREKEMRERVVRERLENIVVIISSEGERVEDKVKMEDEEVGEEVEDGEVGSEEGEIIEDDEIDEKEYSRTQLELLELEFKARALRALLTDKGDELGLGPGSASDTDN